MTRLRDWLMLLLLLLYFPIGRPQRRRSLHVAVCRKRLLDSHICWATMICTGKLAAVGAGRTLILELCSHGQSMLLPHCHPLRGPRRNMETTRSAVVTQMGVARIRNDRAAVEVVNHRGVDVVDRAVVVEVTSAPVTALVAVAGVAKAVVDAAIVADVLAPIAGVIAVGVVPVAPVAGGPKRAFVGRLNSCAGNPIIAVWRPGPVAGRPDIVVAGVLRLVVVR